MIDADSVAGRCLWAFLQLIAERMLLTHETSSGAKSSPGHEVSTTLR